jgi:hypothetical protein
MKFRKKPIIIEASQWHKNGDHPEDKSKWIYPDELPQPTDVKEPFLTEGKVVRYYRHPKVDGELGCPNCKSKMNDHGWIDTLKGGHTVCLGDWIITGVKGERYPFKPDIFEKTYERVD